MKPIAALAFVAVLACGCHAGPGDFPGDYDGVRFTAVLTGPAGRVYNENDTVEKLAIVAADSNGTDSTDFEIQLSGDGSCNLFARRTDETGTLLGTSDCSYQMSNGAATFKLAVAGGSVTLAGGALSVTWSGTFTRAGGTESGTFTAAVTGQKK